MGVAQIPENQFSLLVGMAGILKWCIFTLLSAPIFLIAEITGGYWVDDTVNDRVGFECGPLAKYFYAFIDGGQETLWKALSILLPAEIIF